MKKVLLTLGTTAVIATPISVAISCSKSSPERTIDDTKLNALNISSTKTITELNAASGNLATTEADTDTIFGIVKDQFDSIITALGGETSNWKFVNIDFDKASSKFKLTYKFLFESLDREILLTTTPKLKDDSAIVVELNKLNITTTKTVTELNATAGVPATSEADANTRFGIVKSEIDSIISAFGGISSDWRFVNIDFNITNSKFKLTYKHSSEKVNREIDLNATLEHEDHSLVINELNKLNIASTKNVKELIAIQGSPAASEADANTKFGIVKSQFDLIIDALGGPDGDWKLINIDYFNNNNSWFQLIVNHKDEPLNRSRILYVQGFPSPINDSAVRSELNKLTITSTKTLTELGEINIPILDEEEIITRYGIVKTEFDAIINALGGLTSEWKMFYIQFDIGRKSFILTYKNEYQSFDNNIALNTITKPE